MPLKSIQSFFVFCVRVEEYRNGVKLGEVRRDVQYASLGCQVANPPQISVNNGSANSSNVIEIDAYVDENICFDGKKLIFVPFFFVFPIFFKGFTSAFKTRL